MPPATATPGSPAPATGPGTAVAPANATSIRPTQATVPAARTATEFFLDTEFVLNKEIHMQAPRRFLMSCQGSLCILGVNVMVNERETALFGHIGCTAATAVPVIRSRQEGLVWRREGDAHDLAIPAGELQSISTAADARATVTSRL